MTFATLRGEGQEGSGLAGALALIVDVVKRMVVVINDAQGLWSQLGSFLFIAGGVFADLMLVRLFLLLAYIFLLFNALVGFPSWPDLYSPFDSISIDSVFWNAMGCYVQLSGLVRLLLDERKVPMDEEESAVWRMFYRYSGISRMLFKMNILDYGRFDTFAPGAQIIDEIEETAMFPADGYDNVTYMHDVITHRENANAVSEPEHERRLYIILEGHVRAVTNIHGKKTHLRFSSGDMFEFRYLNLFGVHAGFLDSSMSARARTVVRTFSIPVKSLELMATGSGPMRQAWLSTIIAHISREAERPDLYYDRQADLGVADDTDLVEPLMRRASIFDPLSDEELPPPDSPGSGMFFKRPVLTLYKLCRETFTPPWPFQRPFPGLRHKLDVPPAGRRAAEHVRSQLQRMTIKASQTSANPSTSFPRDRTAWTRLQPSTKDVEMA